ncbi:MAG: hypothetical protein R8G66_33000 [Cytophagales bacterium]|nr:hypothetical protein [Cytophagales bacterium]
MSKWSRQIYSTIILVLVAFCATCQVRVDKEYDQLFALNPGDKVEVTNKYGEVIIQTWYKDSVRIKVNVEARGKNEYAVNKAMRRVDIDLRKIGNLVAAETEIEKKGGMLSELVGEVSDVSNSLFSNQKFTVDYEIWMPADVALSIDNRYGNVYLAQMEGVVDLTLAHGDIRGNRINNQIDLKHSFGKVTFDYIKEGEISLRGSEFKLDEADELFFESSSSEISVKKGNTLKFNSRNDKFYLDKVKNIHGDGSFTDLNLATLAITARLDFSYGDIYLNGIANDFDEVTITGKSTDINLVIDQSSYIQAKISGPEESMFLPNSMLTLQREELEDEQVTLSGTVGNTNTDISTMNVKANNGKIIVAISEVPIFTSRD